MFLFLRRRDRRPACPRGRAVRATFPFCGYLTIHPPHGPLVFRRVVRNLSFRTQCGISLSGNEILSLNPSGQAATFRVTVQWEFARIYPAKSKRAFRIKSKIGKRYYLQLT